MARGIPNTVVAATSAIIHESATIVMLCSIDRLGPAVSGIADRMSVADQTAVVEGANHSSPNAGFPEAAFAGALSVKLNGPNFYNGKLVQKPYIGIHFGKTTTEHIKKACDIMMLSSFLWLMVVWGIDMVIKRSF